MKEEVCRPNIEESGIGHTTPVDAYPLGKSPLGVMDMAGNVWEWQANYFDNGYDRLSYRGGSWDDYGSFARVLFRFNRYPGDRDNRLGFREEVFPSG